LSELSAKLVAALSGRSFAAYNSLYDVPGFGQCRQCWGLRFDRRNPAVVAASHPQREGAPTLLWTQLTNFNDSAETPTLSRDGKLVAFPRGPGSFGSCCEHGPGLDQICAGRRTLATHEDRL